jgi:hypothetical protein
MLFHPKGGSPGGARVVFSCISVVIGNDETCGYDYARRIRRGRQQVVTALLLMVLKCQIRLSTILMNKGKLYTLLTYFIYKNLVPHVPASI